MAEKMGAGPRRGRDTSRHATGATLLVDVLVGIPAGEVATATFPRILKGIHGRAELEIRERPEIERIKIAVRYQAPGDFQPEAEHWPSPGPVRNRERHGTILVYPFEESAVDLLSRRTLAVSVLESYSRLGIDVIDTDDAAISSMVGCLHAAGHARIGFLSWDYPVEGHWVERRFEGFVKGLCDHGLSLHWGWVLNGRRGGSRLNPAQVADAVARMTRQSGVTAWVCAADHQAYHLIASLESRGIRVPRDCSVTGFDGLEPPAGLPRAASMRVPHEHIGSSALTRMINRIMYPSSPQRKILVDARLDPGETIAAPGRP